MKVFFKSAEFEDGLIVNASADGDGLRRISVGAGETRGTDLSPGEIPREVLSHLDCALLRIRSYFDGESRPLYEWDSEDKNPNAPRLVMPEASDFRLKVWKETSEIPYGKTLTYSELACRVGGENHRRAVAGALAANVFPILIPCHRVVAEDGAGGYSAGGVAVKKLLLTMESGTGS